MATIAATIVATEVERGVGAMNLTELSRRFGRDYRAMREMVLTLDVPFRVNGPSWAFDDEAVRLLSEQVRTNDERLARRVGVRVGA